MKLFFILLQLVFYRMKESSLCLISASLKLHPPAAVKRDVVGLGGKGVVAREGCVRASSNKHKLVPSLSVMYLTRSKKCCGL